MVESTLFDLADYRKPLPERVLIFASGINRRAEVEGFTKLEIPIGVSVSRLDRDALDRIIELERPVMVDSGAFSEMQSANERGTSFGISHAEWEHRLAIYFTIASALHERAFLVVPDRVGDQRETLQRISRYRPWLARLDATGAKLLLPLQVGGRTHIEFYEAAQQTAGVPLIPAMPMRKAATSAEPLLKFGAEVKPKHLHLLGMGIDNPRVAPLIQAIRHYSPKTFITMDSNRLRAVAGKGRPLTRVEHELKSAEIKNVFGEVISPVLSTNQEVLDYTDMIAFPSLWADAEHLHVIADHVGLCEQDRVLLALSPDEFLQRSCREHEEILWIEHPVMEQALDRAWRLHVERYCHRGVRQAAISSIFNTSRLRGQTFAP